MEVIKLPVHVRITLGEMFAKYDFNQNGILEREEIRAALKDIFAKLGVYTLITQADIDNFIKDYDKDHNGMYSIHFFANKQYIYIPQEISIPIQQIFLKYDHNKNGQLEYKQLLPCLQDVFNQLGVNKVANEIDVKNFFKDYDANGDGRITKEDFKRIYAIKFHAF